MNFQQKIVNLYDLQLEWIWTISLDEGTNHELILDPQYMCFEIGNKFLEVSDVSGEGKIEVKIKDEVNYKTDMDITYRFISDKQVIFSLDCR